MSHSGAGGAAQGLITQEVVQVFVSNFPGLGLIQVRATQYVIQAFVNDTPVTTPPATGINTGTPVCHPYAVHLDRKCRLLGVASGESTQWTLPIADPSLTTIVLADPAFGSDNGKVIAGSYFAGTVSTLGDYSAGYAILGRPFTMSVELSRPYRRDRTGEALISDRLQVAIVYASHRNSGDYSIRASMAAPPTRSDRTKAFAYATVGSVEEQGETRALLSGWAERMRLFLESALPRPCTISSVKYLVEVGEDDG